jgi:hypothetical protein
LRSTPLDDSRLGQIGLLSKFRGTAKHIRAGQTVTISKMDYDLVACGISWIDLSL